jgi:hypothetical protein
MDPDRMSNQIIQWLERAVESWEEDNNDSAEIALGIAHGFQELYMLEFRGQEIAMMQQRHQLEVVKRMRAEARLESERRKELENEPW